MAFKASHARALERSSKGHDLDAPLNFRVKRSASAPLPSHILPTSHPKHPSYVDQLSRKALHKPTRLSCFLQTLTLYPVKKCRFKSTTLPLPLLNRSATRSVVFSKLYWLVTGCGCSLESGADGHPCFFCTRSLWATSPLTPPMPT